MRRCVFVRKILTILAIVILGSWMAQTVAAQNGPLRILSVDLASAEVVVPCPPGQQVMKPDECGESPLVDVRVRISGDELSNVKLHQTVSGGRIVQGNATGDFVWDMSGVSPGVYAMTVGVARKSTDDIADTKTVTVTVKECTCCGYVDPACPDLVVSGPSGVTRRGEPMTFTANVTGADTENITFNWSLTAGTITSGQGTTSITVDTADVEGDDTVIATVEISGLREGPGPCSTSASEAAVVADDPKARLHHEYKFARDIRSVSFDGFLYAEDLWATMDGYFVALQNDPNERGAVFVYGPSPASIAKLEKAINSYIRVRGFDPGRLTFINGGYERRPIVQMWLVPAGAETPLAAVDHNNDIPPVLVTEYSSALPGATRRNLDLLFTELGSNPDNRGEVQIFAPTLARFRAIERTVNNHIGWRKFDKSRINVEHITAQSLLIRLWRVPPGAEPPGVEPPEIESPAAPRRLPSLLVVKGEVNILPPLSTEAVRASDGKDIGDEPTALSVPPRPPPPPPRVPKIVAGGVLNGKAISLPKPPYPPAARAVRATGAVSVQVTVNEQGNVISAAAVNGHPLLRASAVQAARQAKFSPTTLSGVPVKITGIIVYNFVP
jgi:TonB family protein